MAGDTNKSVVGGIIAPVTLSYTEGNGEAIEKIL